MVHAQQTVFPLVARASFADQAKNISVSSIFYNFNFVVNHGVCISGLGHCECLSRRKKAEGERECVRFDLFCLVRFIA